MRGLEKVQPRRKDPTTDAREKTLQKVATRGVVRLFNAVAKAQKVREEAGVYGAKKASKLNRASLFQQLRGSAKRPGDGVGVVAPVDRRAIGEDGDGTGRGDNHDDDEEGGWDVLSNKGVGVGARARGLKD